jgi:predicted nuclease of predicted toxin-antitoxin system
LIAYERGRLKMVALLDRARHSPPVILAPVVAQVWRDGARQARLARLVGGSSDVVSYDLELARQAGGLLATTGLSDAVDAGVAVLAHRLGGIVVTSDPEDLARLAGALPDPPRIVIV